MKTDRTLQNVPGFSIYSLDPKTGVFEMIRKGNLDQPAGSSGT